MDTITRKKWDKAAKTFDTMSGIGPEKRWAPAKQALFNQMGEGRILFLAAGTGLDFPSFPPGKNIVAIDISGEMLKIAAGRATDYEGNIELRQMDVHELEFPADHFDQVFTSCTFCSVPRPVEGLASLKAAMKPGAGLHMFEHTGSAYFPFKLMMNVMTPLSRAFGPEMNRNTTANVRAAGFVIDQVDHIYLDVVKVINAHKPAE